MCRFTGDCDAGDEAYWEDEPSHFDGASVTAFGCESCGFSDAL